MFEIINFIIVCGGVVLVWLVLTEGR